MTHMQNFTLDSGSSEDLASIKIKSSDLKRLKKMSGIFDLSETVTRVLDMFLAEKERESLTVSKKNVSSERRLTRHILQQRKEPLTVPEIQDVFGSDAASEKAEEKKPLSLKPKVRKAARTEVPEKKALSPIFGTRSVERLSKEDLEMTLARVKSQGATECVHKRKMRKSVIIDVNIDGHLYKLNSWNYLLEVMIEKAYTRKVTFDEIKACISSPLSQKDQPRYKRVPETTIYYKQRGPEEIMRSVLRLAQKLGMSLLVNFKSKDSGDEQLYIVHLISTEVDQAPQKAAEKPQDLSKKIKIGSTVELQWQDTKKTRIYEMILGTGNISEGLLGSLSPLGKLVMEKTIGSVVKFQANGYEREVKILDIA